MTGRDLIRIGHKMFGRQGWVIALAAILKVDASTIRRWIAADKIPGPAAVALKFLEKEFEDRRWS